MWPDWPLEAQLPEPTYAAGGSSEDAGRILIASIAKISATTIRPTARSRQRLTSPMQVELIAAVAAEFSKHYEAELQAAETADWCSLTG